MDEVKTFNEYRKKMNDRILEMDNKIIKRIFNLDTNAFTEGAVNIKSKELIGLACSMVLRCDDCIRYHLGRCSELDVSTDEVFEVFGIANLIGGTIVIPHLRRAVEFWDELAKHKHQ